MTIQRNTLDFEALATFYADEAEVLLVNEDHPPSAPLELRGKE